MRSGATPYGQGHVTTWAMIVADRTGVPIEDIKVIHGDTDQIRTGGLTVGSRSVQLGGSAIAAASTKLIDQARERAAQLLEAAKDDVVLDADAGRFHVAGTPVRVGVVGRRRCGSRRRGHRARRRPRLRGADADVPVRHPRRRRRGRHRAPAPPGSSATSPCDDAGNLLNPLLAEGQVHGGIAQGVAQALMEEIVYDEDGTPKTTNFADYPVISAAELPSFEIVHMETPTWVNELGAKGVGESGTIGGIPSVYNAVIDAVSHLGVRHMTMPCTPEKVWAAINEASAVRA